MAAVDFIARIFGPLYITVAIALMVGPARYRLMVDDFIEEPVFTYLGGVMALIAGLLILNFHSAWSADWRGLVTLIGWLGAAKGATLIIFPTAFAELNRAMTGTDGKLRVVGGCALVLGLYLAAGGYGLI